MNESHQSTVNMLTFQHSEWEWGINLQCIRRGQEGDAWSRCHTERSRLVLCMQQLHTTLMWVLVYSCLFPPSPHPLTRSETMDIKIGSVCVCVRVCVCVQAPCQRATGITDEVCQLRYCTLTPYGIMSTWVNNASLIDWWYNETPQCCLSPPPNTDKPRKRAQKEK